LAVAAVPVPDHLAQVLRSDAWMHAAGGIFCRQAVRAGARARAAGASALLPAEQVLAVPGQAAGRPWRRMDKDAARAAITMLRQAAGPG